MKGLADVQLTLYDIFGYLVVGLATFAGLSVLTWALVLPGATLRQPSLDSAGWFVVLVVAYILGHLVQAIANAFFERFTSIAPNVRSEVAWHPLKSAIEEAAGLRALQGNPSDVEEEKHAKKLFELCDIVVAQKGVPGGDREIYQYREGFYRGLTVACTIGLAAVFALWAQSGDAVVGEHVLTEREYAFAAGVLAVSIVLAYHRYLRFHAYKVHNALGSFALVAGLMPVSPRDAGSSPPAETRTRQPLG